MPDRPPDPPVARLLAVLAAARKAGCSFALGYDEPTGEWVYLLDIPPTLKAYEIGQPGDFDTATDAALDRLEQIEAGEDGLPENREERGL